MIRATGRYADGWFPGTTRAVEYGEQLTALRTAASDAGRDPMEIKPALIRFIVTGRSRDEVDEVIDSNIAKVLRSTAPPTPGHATVSSIRSVRASPAPKS